eukprot:ctg_129.g94
MWVTARRDGVCPRRGVCLAEAEEAVQRGVGPTAEDATAAWPWQRIWRPGAPGDSERAAAAAALTTRGYHTCRRTLEQILAYAERNSEERFLLASASTAADPGTSTRRAPTALEGSKDEDAPDSSDDSEPSKSASEPSPAEDETPTAAAPSDTAPLELEPAPSDFSRPLWEESPAADAPETKPSQEAPRPLPARRNPRVSDTTTRSGRQRRCKRVSFWTRALGFCGRGCLLLLLRLFASRRQWTLTRTAIIVSSILPGPQQPLALAFFQPLAFGYAASPTLRKLRPGLWRSLEFWQRVIPVYISYKMTAKKANKLSAADARLLWEERHAWGSERVYRLCIELRGFFLKDGRLLSRREDFLPSAWCSRLGMLEDCVPPVPIDEIRATVQEAFGIPMESASLRDARRPLGGAQSAVRLAGEAVPAGPEESAPVGALLAGVRTPVRLGVGAHDEHHTAEHSQRQTARLYCGAGDCQRSGGQARPRHDVYRRLQDHRRRAHCRLGAGHAQPDGERGHRVRPDDVGGRRFSCRPASGQLAGDARRPRGADRLWASETPARVHAPSPLLAVLGAGRRRRPPHRHSLPRAGREDRHASRAALQRGADGVGVASEHLQQRALAHRNRGGQRRRHRARLCRPLVGSAPIVHPPSIVNVRAHRHHHGDVCALHLRQSSGDGRRDEQPGRRHAAQVSALSGVSRRSLPGGALRAAAARIVGANERERLPLRCVRSVRRQGHSQDPAHERQPRGRLSLERPRSQGRMPPTPAVQSPRTRSSGSISSESSNVQPPGRASPGLHPADRPSRTHASRSVLPSERSVSAPNSPMNDASSRWALTAPSESPLKQPRQL